MEENNQVEKMIKRMKPEDLKELFKDKEKTKMVSDALFMEIVLQLKYALQNNEDYEKVLSIIERLHEHILVLICGEDINKAIYYLVKWSKQFIENYVEFAELFKLVKRELKIEKEEGEVK